MDNGSDAGNAHHLRRNSTIQHGHTVLFKLPNGEVRSTKVEKDSCGIASLLCIEVIFIDPAQDSIARPGRKLKRLPPLAMQDIAETDATNELINDGDFVQPLTVAEIEDMKKSGFHASEIIKTQIEQHANYSLKTEYSKEKYKQRKEAKYSKRFEIIEPTIYEVCDYWFRKDHHRIRDIRTDTLSQMLNLANVRPGGKYIIVDEASGLVVSAVLDRLGGECRIISINDSDSPPAYPVLNLMNYDKKGSCESAINAELGNCSRRLLHAPLDPTPGCVYSERQRARLDKRKVASDAVMKTRSELFAGGFDGLLVASEYDSFQIVEALSPYLAGSASIVVQSQFLQVKILIDSNAPHKIDNLIPVPC
ncbi:Gcd10p-domain-containing protein [Pisolithus croceorrhizus]|nr:Gcd10p-domain-containing protein [Pisolithus croceorrhizus]